MPDNNFGISGLTPDQIIQSRNEHGYNRVDTKKQNPVLNIIKSLIKEPMVILLLVAATIYFISGDIGDGIFLAVSILLVSAISIYQDSRSRNALEKLKSFTKPFSKVIRNGSVETINTEELVVGDSLIVEEGLSVAADGIIVHSNDFSVNEAILTGESMAVYKDNTKEDKLIYQGATVASGMAIVTVTAIGNNTRLAKIGISLDSIEPEQTPLEIQINGFVKKMVIAGAIVFAIVWALNYFNTYNLLASLLKALTLAMSILPEEIPVAYTTFMALGAWRLMQMGVIVKQMKTVETLGSATVICTDKTGTITENKMSLAKVFSLKSEKIADPSGSLSDDEKYLIKIAMWASEPIPFDQMEISLHDAYHQIFPVDERPQYHMIHEYPLGGKPPMMTHIFENNIGKRIIAAKGAPEAIMNVCNLSDIEKQKIQDTINEMAAQSYRILGVAEADFASTAFPAIQQQFKFTFKGLVAFYDPPKKNIQSVFETFYKAGIAVKIITGDNPVTTAAIAKQVGFAGYDNNLTGDELMALPDSELKEKVINTNLFTRMFPDAKLKIINALKAKNQVVAMTGDGVNDGPALKAAHIGIAMGQKGTEIAKDAASLILQEDDLSKMTEAIAMGRRIYTNLKKAIRYIISIHIPIILTVFIPLALGWIYPNILSPVHVIFLELIMGPTCSIIYENEPIEENTMTQMPRPFTDTFFNWKELTTSIIQGLVITLGVLFIYQYAISAGQNEKVTRTMVFIVLIVANIGLTLVNRSFLFSVITTLKYRNNLVLIIIGITTTLALLLLYVKPLTNFFEFEILTSHQLLISIGTGLVSVMWYEIVKWKKRLNTSY
ncbi:MAG: cation-translocating P-type ATPase [Sphingobacteriaceae bacterium]|nr:MAG: cation-translocating P-type ATPase [Sphingobacteriaceae bacterium]